MQTPAVDFINGHKGIRLYCRSYINPAPVHRRGVNTGSRAQIIVLHGAGEYSEKYARLAEWFASRAIDVYLVDLRGHGRSDGPRCHAEDFNDYILDLDKLIRFIEQKNSREKTFLVSHSLGGLIAFFYALNFPYRIAGIAASSPCLGLKLKIDPVKVWAISIFYRMLKNKSFASHIEPSMVTHDPYIIQRFAADPLIHHTVTASFYVQMTKAIRYIKNNAGELRMPVFILQAGDDKICDVNTAKEFYQAIGSKDKGFKLYEGFYHEVLNEAGRETAYEDIYNWIIGRC